MPTSTPWGPAQSSTKIAPGIMSYETARHGGIHLSKKRNAMVPDYMRKANGWYEEDAEWSIVAVCFPEEFYLYYDEGMIVTATRVFRNWYPNEYERYLGKELKEGESHVRDKELFFKRHADDYVVISATMDASGKVLATATPGGVRDFSLSRNFLVEKAEYDTRSNYGFVINPNVHEDVSAF